MILKKKVNKLFLFALLFSLIQFPIAKSDSVKTVSFQEKIDKLQKDIDKEITNLNRLRYLVGITGTIASSFALYKYFTQKKDVIYIDNTQFNSHEIKAIKELLVANSQGKLLIRDDSSLWVKFTNFTKNLSKNVLMGVVLPTIVTMPVAPFLNWFFCHHNFDWALNKSNLLLNTQNLNSTVNCLDFNKEYTITSFNLALQEYVNAMSFIIAFLKYNAQKFGHSNVCKRNQVNTLAWQLQDCANEFIKQVDVNFKNQIKPELTDSILKFEKLFENYLIQIRVALK